MGSIDCRPALLAATAVSLVATAAQAADGPFFRRIATLPIYANLPSGTDPAAETAAEIIAATPDGMRLVYTDSPGGRLGFIDLADPARPRPASTLALDGEPTAVTVVGATILAAINTSASHVEPSGHVAVVPLSGEAVIARCDVGGQPDSVAASPDGRFLAVAVENERDEDLNDGVIPQLPAGHLAILDLDADGRPTNCDAARIVGLTGLAALAGDDPEPEFVDVNAAGIAAVTLQENNHIALVDLAAGAVVGHFPAGSVDLKAIDSNDDGIIAATGAKVGVAREPDAIGWLGEDRLVTANEGDYEGGSRGFSIFAADGTVLHDSGALLEHAAMRIGHFPVRRAKSKGVEPEGAEVGTFGGERLIFIAAERASIVAVLRDGGPGAAPELLQILPTGVGPEGLLAIPARNLLVVAAEADSAEDNVRSTVSIYARDAAAPLYPTLVSADEGATGAPIGWGALSGLAGDPADPARLYAVSDSFYGSSRIFTLDVGQKPARITGFVELSKDGQLAPYDLEGVALREGGGFWLVSEGNPESKNPLTQKSLLLQVAADGTVEREIALPAEVDSQAIRFGHEGVAGWTVDGAERVVVAVQRSWKDDPDGHAKLAVYDPAADSWGFVHYPLDPPSSPAGGWVGLSEITALGDGRFALIERDNQPGPMAALKTVTIISLDGVQPSPAGEKPPLAVKAMKIDLLAALQAAHGWTADKPEGLALAADGRLWLVTDNDGVSDSSGETLLLELGPRSLLD